MKINSGTEPLSRGQALDAFGTTICGRGAGQGLAHGVKGPSPAAKICENWAIMKGGGVF